MNNSIIPIAVVYAWEEEGPGGHALHFNCKDGEVLVTNYIREFLDVLRLCTGLNPLDAIKETLSHIDGDVIDAVIAFSLRKGIILDARRQYRALHEASSNPSIYLNPLNPDQVARLQAGPRIMRRRGEIYRLPQPASASALARLAWVRESTRIFAKVPIGLEKLTNFLTNLYGTGERKFTPSAGALYPIDIYLVLFSPAADLPLGIYQLIPETTELVRVNADAHLDSFSYALENSEFLNEYTAIVFLTANIERVARKYANRAYRYTLIEAGHVAQNAYLHAAEAKLGVLEYGGYNDKAVAALLGVSPSEQPILSTIVFGKQAAGNFRHPNPSFSNLAHTLDKSLVRRHKIVREPHFRRFKLGSKVVPRVYATASYTERISSGLEERHLTACGEGHCSDEAKVKVLAEAYERHICGRIRVDCIEPASSLNCSFLDPRRAYPLRYGEYNADLVPFELDKKTQWVKGYNLLSGEEVLLPIETVFYPLYKNKLRRRYCYKSNSSGVAAHIDKDVAILNAILELVERDALMVLWYAKRQVEEIQFAKMPPEIGGRAALFQEAGIQVRFFDLTLDTVPVVLCTMIGSKGKAGFVTGASAAFDIAVAATKAFNEASFMLLSWRGVRHRSMNPSCVVFPQDHGILYFNGDRNSELDWLLNAPLRSVKGIPVVSAEALFKKVAPHIVHIAEPTPSIPLWVIRAVSQDFLPINFGYGSEHLGHSRLETLGLKWARDYPSIPHFFA